MDNNYKAIAAKCAREGKTKLELMMLVPSATPSEVKEINLFFEVSKEILGLLNANEKDDVLRRVIVKFGFDENDLELIKGKKELKNILADIGTTLVSLLFVLVFVFVVGSLFLNIISTTDWDFMKKDYAVSGLLFGDDTNFSDLNITTNAVLKNFSINGNEYFATIRCSKELTLSFTKKGFVPVHKNISCEGQNLDIVFATMSEFVKLDFNKTTKVEDKGVKLDVNANDLVVMGTNKVPVNPSVSVTAFNPNTPGDMQYFPGELEGLLKDGNVTGLESYGFAKIIAQDENGNNLDFKNGKSATVTFPLDPKQNTSAPTEMPLWYFSEEKGTWVEEGMAKKTCIGNNCQYIGQITKVRSWHNLDKLIQTIKKDLNNWGPEKKDCNDLEKLMNSNFWKKLKEMEQQIKQEQGSVNFRNQASTLIYHLYADTTLNNAIDGCKINPAIGSILVLRSLLTDTRSFFSYPTIYNCGDKIPKQDYIVELCDGKKVDFSHALFGFNSPFAAGLLVTDFIGDPLVGLFGGQTGSQILGGMNAPDFWGDITAFSFGPAGEIYGATHPEGSSLTDFFTWFFSNSGSSTQTSNEYYGLGGIYGPFFTFSGGAAGFSLVGEVNSIDGGLFVQLIDNVYLSTTKSFTSSFSSPKVITFTPFAYLSNNKLVLVTSTGEVNLNQPVPKNGFSLNYPYGTEFYKKVGKEFLLDKIVLLDFDYNRDDLDKFDLNSSNVIYYFYENNNLSKIKFGKFEKLFIYDGEEIVKIIYSSENENVLSYNFNYFENKLSSISVYDSNKALILTKLNWSKNELEINSINNNLLINVDDGGKVTKFNNIGFDYNLNGVYVTSFGDNLIRKSNEFAFLVKGQSITKSPVAFENIGKPVSFTYSNQISSTAVGDPKIVFAINKVPSSVASASTVPSNGATFGGYALENCSFWSGYPIDLADCVIGWDKINGLTSNEALNYVSTLGLSSKDTGIIYTKLADYFVDLNFCHNILNKDYYSGLACIKLVDDGKVIYSNQNISNILNKRMDDYSLSFSLRNLAEYYMDRNYCLPIPTESQREACLAKFSKPIVIPIVVPLCGNGKIDEKEKCDGNNFNGLSCATFGFDSGKLFCVNCQLNKSGCFNAFVPPIDFNKPVEPTSVCGNGKIEGNEDCDASNFDGATCIDFGFASGNLKCVDCRVDTNSCVSTPATPTQTCGNNIIEGTEQCEGSNLNGKNCATYGFNSGTLSCSNCQIINRNCVNVKAPPVEIDPLQIFNCPYNENYSSPVKDEVSQSFYIKKIQNGEVWVFRIPFKKSSCNADTLLTEDENGNIIPCITQLGDNDGCILDKARLLPITASSDTYITNGKYNNVYKQNPVDFASDDGNIFFLIKSGGKHEYIKFVAPNYDSKEIIPIYDENDYTLRNVPSVFRSVPSGNVFWVVLAGALHDVYVASDPSCGNVPGCFNNPNTTTAYGGTGDADMGTTSYVTAYGWGKVFIAKSISSGDEFTRINNMVPCYESCRYTPFGGGYTGTAYLTEMSFIPTQMTYKGDGFGNLLVRSNTDLNEYSTDSNDVMLPSATR